MDVHAVLVAQRAGALERIAALTADLDAVAAAAAGSNIDDEHDPEGATVAFEREQAAALRTQARDQVRNIDAAFERLAAGTYGVCEKCGNPIAPARLEVLPAATLCVRCAAKRR